MLENIKSKFFVRYLFSLMDDGQQLHLVKYNKILQKLLNINIMNYRFFSRKYTIYEANGIGKIYNAYENNLIYEGGLINGRRNGKGKEYDYYDELIFEGEYINGKRSGKGKEYNYKGELIFEGEFLNGERWIGNGKEYEYDGTLIYEGEYLNGKRNGKGKEYCYGELSFEGEYLNGKRYNGKGIVYDGIMILYIK